MNAATLLLHGLETLATVVDPADPEHTAEAAKAARILAFLRAEGVADVLEAIRDGADVAVDIREEPDGRSKDHRIIALHDASAAITDAIGRLAGRTP